MSNRNIMKSNERQPKINICSTQLTQEENEAVFKMLGKKCQTLNTAVVQIYKTEGSAHSHWKKKYTGVVCLIKDSPVRSYFLRAYCLIENKLIWEHEIYYAMKIVKARPFLLTFEGQDGHVGLNFVSEDECDSFYRTVDKIIEKNDKRAEKLNRPKEPVNLPMGQSTTDSTTVQLRNHSKINSVTVTPALAPAPAAAPTKNFLTSAGFGLSSNKDKKRKVTKAEISAPTNFVHISHVGWDADKGFDLTGNENDEYLSKFFAKAGVSETELKDRDTRRFIYDFIQSNNVLESVKSEHDVEKPKAAAPAPPPVPSRHHHNQNGSIPNTASVSSNATSQKVAPPRPPARHPPPPVPTTVPGATRTPGPPARQPPITAPPPPTAISAPSVAPPPPPPPPPAAAVPPPPPPMPTITTTHAPTQNKAPSNLPPITDTRNALMESIRKGTTLKKVDTSTHSTGSSDSRNDLMLEIRQGIELRPAQNRELSTNRGSDDGADSDILASALRRALQERGRVMQSSDDDESESSDNDDDWD